jgi:hypothetical protein
VVANLHAAAPAAAPEADRDVFSAIERLGELRDKGILTDQEFSQKKAELLARV